MTTKIETYGQLLEKIRKLEAEKAELVRTFDDMVLVQQRTEAERDALRAAWADNDRGWRDKMVVLRAENHRLRAQLKAVFDQLDRDLGSPREGVLSDLRRSYAAG